MNLQNYSHYSVLDSILTPSQIVDIAVDNNHGFAAITDINSMAGVVQLNKAANKAGLKPIFGLTTFFMDGSTIVLLAQNKTGYTNILRLLSLSNTKEQYIRHAQLSFEILRDNDTSNIICLTGHEGSSLHRSLYSPGDETIRPDVEQYVDIHLGLLKSAFGDRLYLQSEPHFSDEIDDIYKRAAQKHSLKIANTNQVRYSNHKHSKYLFDIVRATNEKCTINSLDDYNEIGSYHHDKSLNYSVNQEIIDRIEAFDILDRPRLPKFNTPDGQSSHDYMRAKCWDGYKHLFGGIKNDQYINRIKFELDSFQKEDLEDYFLILADIIKYAKSKGNLIGPGRGSAAGCLISYLLGITQLDPIQYGLIFERFWNPGRAGSMPDIDVDFPKSSRDDVINYITKTYGQDRTAQISTYQTLMGRAAIKAVLRAEGNLSFTEMNDITANIVDKAKISDELQDMKEEGRQPSVILWALENKPRALDQWAYLEDDESIEGPLAMQFRHAIALEGVKSALSKHAAGVVIGHKPLDQIVPMVYDPKSQKQIIGMEYEDAELQGAVKLDVLGLSTLDKLMDI